MPSPRLTTEAQVKGPAAPGRRAPFLAHGVPRQEQAAIRGAFDDAQVPASHKGSQISSKELVRVRDVVAPNGVDQFERAMVQGALARAGVALTPDGASASRDLLRGERYDPVPAPPPDASPQDEALALGRRYLGYGTNDLTEFSDFQGGPDAYSCTEFVSWMLKQTGQIDQVFQVGDDLKAYALSKPGWREVAPSEAHPGDVVRMNVNTDQGPVLHTVLLSRILDDGAKVYLGANYTDGVLDLQTVTENRLQGAEPLWALRYDPQTSSAGSR